MNWDDIGFLLSKNKYNENSLIVEIFTEKHGKVSGIIFGGSSKKIKNYLQIGNKIFVNYNAKSREKLGYFKIEIYQALSPFYFDNHQKLSCISCAMNLIKLLTAESQQNLSIYSLIDDFFNFLKKDDWIKDYIFWELELFKIIGFDLELDNLVTKELLNDKIVYVVKSKTEKKIIPNFLIDKKILVNDLKTLLNGLKLVSDFLEKTVLKPNNLKYPISRTQFINSLK